MEELLVVSQFYRPEPIGTPFYVTDMANWFAAGGCDVTVLTGRPYYPEFRLRPGYEAGQRDRETIDGVSIVRLPTLVPTQGRAAQRILSEANFLLRATAALVTGKTRRGRYVISFAPSALAVLAGALATRRGGRHMAVVHDIQSGLAAGLGLLGSGVLLRIVRATERYCLNRADHLVVLSEQMRDALLSLGIKRPIDIIPIWVDTGQINPLPRPEAAASTILYGGNLGRKQGLEQLLDLAEVLRDERPDIRILIRGGGSQEESLKDSAQLRGLPNLRFEPLLPMDRFNEGLAEGDVHLVPQDPEAADFAVPSKVYNIMAAGRPFIATALPGSTLWALQEQSRALICVPPNNPREFADAVIGLIDDQKRRTEMGIRGRAYVETTVARDVVLKHYAELMTDRPAT